ncbi:MAG: hypothetical protein OEL19_08755 [Sulfurimonas sp.]|nr:hypothetical protein [Sulfurimonas sp.]
MPVPATKKTQTSQTKSASQEMSAFKNDVKKGSVPQIVLPPVYEDVSLFDEKRITFAAQGAKFSNVMYQIAKESGLNLILDKDVNPDIPITLSIKDANLKDALGIVMDISGCYYQLKGNILYVKGFEQKNFTIPYVHSKTSFKTDLGGNTLGSVGGGKSSNGGDSLKGDFSLKFSNSEEANDFYGQFEKNIKSLISPEGRYTLNRFSGTLNVYDRRKNIDAIEEIVNKIKKETSRQVLIEAKILEVVLNDNHSLGVNWDVVANSVLQSGDQLNIGQALGLGGAVAGTMSYTSRNFSAVINALDESGDVDTLSNPSISVLSGQSAIISSGKLVPFWEKEVQTTSDNSASNTEVTYNRRDVLDGVTMGVTPTVLEDGRIMLNIIPITSSIEEVVDYKDQNGVSVATAPILNIKEAGTIIYAHDDNLVLIGGLINNSVSKSEQKVPLLGDMPLMGGLFTKTVNTDQKRELVILIRLKIVQ